VVIYSTLLLLLKLVPFELTGKHLLKGLFLSALLYYGKRFSRKNPRELPLHGIHLPATMLALATITDE
jgi:hypothetical protein